MPFKLDLGGGGYRAERHQFRGKGAFGIKIMWSAGGDGGSGSRGGGGSAGDAGGAGAPGRGAPVGGVSGGGSGKRAAVRLYVPGGEKELVAWLAAIERCCAVRKGAPGPPPCAATPVAVF
jgi:hypothetical protein